jgi:ankyrin repeat protein
MLDGIKESEATCRHFTAVIDSEKLHTGMEEHTAQLEDIKQDTAQIQSTMLGQTERQRRTRQEEEQEKRKQLWNELLAALFTSNYEEHKGRNADRVQGTCEWSTSHPLLKSWKEAQSSSLLWISADPGCGKSVLAKYLVDHVVPTAEKGTTCYFFFKADSSDQRSAANAMCAILRQLFLQRPELREKHPWILDKFSTDKNQLTTSFLSLWDMLVKVSTSYEDGEVICILDALDECAEADRQQLTGALDKLYRNPSHKGILKFLATSRPYAHIQREFQLLKNALPTIHLSGEGEVEANKIEQEINLVIQRRVEEIGAKLELENHERSFLRQELLLIPNRTYLWVTLIFDMVEKTLSYTNKRLREMIKTLPRTVDEAYERILNQSPDKEKARKLLHLVVGAVRPLTVSEMRMALAVDPAHSEYASLDLEPEARFAKTVRNLCGLFVTIVKNRIYLLHQTAKEFLVSGSVQQNHNNCKNGAISPTVHQPRDNYEDAGTGLGRWKHSLHPVETNRILLEACVSYLQLDLFSEDESNDNPIHAADEHIFLHYSAIHWTTHFRHAEMQADSELLHLVRKICKPGSKCVNEWLKMYWRNMSQGSMIPKMLRTELMVASYFQLEEFAEFLLRGPDPCIDHEDPENGRTALSLAAENGSEEIARMLINHGAQKLDAQDRRGSTPLIWAAEYGHIGIVRLLLGQQKGIDFHKSTFRDHQTALWHAINRGCEDMVALLLNSGADAIHMAPFGGPMTFDRLTPLAYAARNGYEGIVKLLLRTPGLDPDGRDPLNRSPLSFAAEAGHFPVVTLLTNTRAVDLDAKDKLFGRTPLLWAAVHEREAVVEHLVDAGATDIECAGQSPSRTALSYYSERGNTALVKLLLGTGLVDPNSQSTGGRTPLSYACEQGHGAIVELLLGTGIANANSQSNYGRTPLSYACEGGHVDIVRRLLALEAVDPDLADSGYGRTPLSWAASRGHREVAQLLLDTKAVDLGSRDVAYKRTPAMWAAANNHDKLAHLLKHPDPEEDNQVLTLLTT